MASPEEFSLRCELRSHLEDVRCLCVTEVGLVTGSRDKTIKVWIEDGPTSFSVASTLVGHTGYVSALSYAPPSPTGPAPSGALVSGSQDATVGVWDINLATMTQQLQGHQYQVTGVGITPSGQIVFFLT
ncbi:hypothetical protein Ndes2437B_g01788 [Nannochloris sp. 'desiccata']